MSDYYFFFYVILIVVVVLVPEISNYRKIKNIPDWNKAVKDMLNNRSEIVFLQHLPELRIFSLSYYDFRNLLRREDFSRALEKLYDWSMKRMPLRMLNMLFVVVYILGWLTVFWLVSEKIPDIKSGYRLTELLGAFIQVSGILQIYFLIIRPFMKSSRFVRGKAGLEVRKTEQYFPLNLYMIFLISGIIAYVSIGFLVTGTRFSAGVMLAFVHILSLYFFAKQVIEKGAPFDGSTEFGALTNRALLHAAVTEIIRNSMVIILIHLYLEFFLGKAVEMQIDFYNLLTLFYIFAALVVILGKSFFSMRREAAKIHRFLQNNEIG